MQEEIISNGDKTMIKIYEVRTGLSSQDFDDKGEAIAAVEAHGSGSVATFIRGFDGRDRSCALQSFDDGAWKGVDISR